MTTNERLKQKRLFLLDMVCALIIAVVAVLAVAAVGAVFVLKRKKA